MQKFCQAQNPRAIANNKNLNMIFLNRQAVSIDIKFLEL